MSLCNEMAKAVLRSPHIEEFQTNDALLYAFLAAYFEQLQERRDRERNGAISEGVVKAFFASQLPPTTTMTATSRLVAQRTLTQAVVSGGGNVASIAEVFEVAKAFGAQVKALLKDASAVVKEATAAQRYDVPTAAPLKDAFRSWVVGSLSPSVVPPTAIPFGQVHVLHFAAALLTLVPSASLWGLASIALDTTSADDAAGMFLCWAAVDEANRSDLLSLVYAIWLALIHERPKTVTDGSSPSQVVLTRFSFVAYVGMAADAVDLDAANDEEETQHQPPAAASSASLGPVVVSYDDEGHLQRDGEDEDDHGVQQPEVRRLEPPLKSVGPAPKSDADGDDDVDPELAAARKDNEADRRYLQNFFGA